MLALPTLNGGRSFKELLLYDPPGVDCPLMILLYFLKEAIFMIVFSMLSRCIEDYCKFFVELFYRFSYGALFNFSFFLLYAR